MNASSAREAWLSFTTWLSDTPLMHAGVSASTPQLNINDHKPPGMPTMIDEQQVDPRSVYDLRGQPLTTVVDGDAQAGKMLHIFSSRRDAAAYVESREAPINDQPRVRQSEIHSVSQALTAGPPPGQGFFELYANDDLDGCSWRILEWEGLTFNYSRKFACGFLFWGWISADNRVSSIDSYVSADHVFLWDFPNLAGSNLWIPTGAFRINSLSVFGWKNRISSQNVLYF
ncbi:hypothetical protein [Arthrobacter sp. ZGTC131]|uniref:hypothetical protein n=1 Tax=Arthrobacter sp. ZGTC131 TaxID=2058898 RepID=UPI0011B01095|nr:hypothetical protein [Arthrobacter sp. ZGTC131]